MLRHTPKLLNFLNLETQDSQPREPQFRGREHPDVLESIHVRERDQYSKRLEAVKNNLALPVIAEILPKCNNLKMLSEPLLQRGEPGRQPRLIARGGILVQHAL